MVIIIKGNVSVQAGISFYLIICCGGYLTNPVMLHDYFSFCV